MCRSSNLFQSLPLRQEGANRSIAVLGIIGDKFFRDHPAIEWLKEAVYELGATSKSEVGTREQRVRVGFFIKNYVRRDEFVHTEVQLANSESCRW